MPANRMGNEADTCRTLITPKLQAVGWESEPHSIAEQRNFTDGRIVVHRTKAACRPTKRAVRFFNQWGTAEEWIEARTNAARLTRLYWHDFVASPAYSQADLLELILRRTGQTFWVAALNGHRELGRLAFPDGLDPWKVNKERREHAMRWK